MDRWLLDEFIIEADDQLFDSLSSYFVLEANKQFDIDGMTFCNYYANNGYSLQFVVSTKKSGKKIQKEEFCIHHTSPNIWNVNVMAKTRANNTYVITTDDGNQMVPMRFVNHNEFKNRYKNGEKVKAQVVGFVLNGNIYESEEAYQKSLESKEIRVGENCMLPLRLLINNNPKKTKAEKDATLPDEDRVVAANFTIKSCHKIPLHIFGQDRPAYYAMEVETAYGDMHLFFSINSLDERVEQFKKGDIFAGNIMLSGDVYFPEDNAQQRIYDNFEEQK